MHILQTPVKFGNALSEGKLSCLILPIEYKFTWTQTCTLDAARDARERGGID